MNEFWVVNASPIIVLAKAGLNHLLDIIPDEVLAADGFAAIRAAGLYLDTATIAAALHSVGEA